MEVWQQHELIKRELIENPDGIIIKLISTKSYPMLITGIPETTATPSYKIGISPIGPIQGLRGPDGRKHLTAVYEGGLVEAITPYTALTQHVRVTAPKLFWNEGMRCFIKAAGYWRLLQEKYSTR